MLRKSRKYADVRLEAAQAAEKSLTAESKTDERAAIARAIYESAAALGQDKLATAAHAQWQKLDAQLDEEYLEAPPAVTIKPFAGRSEAEDDRVVLMEFFTGAQCPPCVAADLAFDALLETYRPAELIGLQYHLHVPGPDPLANPDSIARSQYYELRGTPWAYFNGKALPGGGGPRAIAQAKYDAYAKTINDDLAGIREATIDLKVARAGSTLRIDVSAAAKPATKKIAANRVSRAAAGGDDGAADTKDDSSEASDKEKDDSLKPQLKLRLVLAQEVVRYAGGNKLRFHHHVVRGMPGGAEGKNLVDGRCAAQMTVDLDGIRAGLDRYLAEFAAEQEFPEPLPQLELSNLSVVALVQDDADKRVLDAALVPVAEPK
jgi:hypothetical protein